MWRVFRLISEADPGDATSIPNLPMGLNLISGVQPMMESQRFTTEQAPWYTPNRSAPTY